MRLPTAYILSHLFIMCRFRHSLCILVSFLVLAPLVPAAPVKITFSADKLQGSGGKGQTSTSLTGNAKVSVDSLNIYGERIELYGKDYRYIKASGNVTGEDAEKGFTFSAASLSYDIILLQMAVKLKSKGIACDSLFAVYNRNTSMLELTGKPTVKKGKDEFKAARISVNLDTEDIKLEGKVSGSVTEEKEEETTKTETPPKGAISSKEETKTP